MGTTSLMKKIKLKNIVLSTIIYLVATVILLVFLNIQILKTDTNRVLHTIDTTKTLLAENPNSALPNKFQYLPAGTQNQETAKIEEGADYAQSVSRHSIEITSPIRVDGVITGYLHAEDSRTSPWFTNMMVGGFALIVYLACASYVFVHARRNYLFTQDIVAKIKNIERSPLTQSYLMSENDDKVTLALNSLGEYIQNQILSHSEKKENIYEFIELFQFPIFIYNAKGKIRKTNASFKNEFADTHNLDIFSPYADFLSFLVDKMLNPTTQEKNFYFENINAYYQVRISPLPDLDNRFLVTLLDITAFKRTLNAHNELIANVSHELKTPLTSIKGFAELLKDDTLSEADRHEFSHIISKESSRLIALVQDTLLLTKQNIHIDKKKINLATLVEEILNTSQPLLDEKHLSLQTDIAPISQVTNRQMVHSIFENLIENAIKYTDDHGKIYVGLHQNKKKVVFTVTDNGPGLTEIEKSRIFERFYRVDESRTQVTGTGLGLSIVDKNVRELQGHIEVISVPGKGTTFTVTL
ncbi:cell wall metabolism sensor histidine kinase WalK [Lactococcus garvieae]|uniref:histidine kinase n=1 Tax=Lactococcus garvieae TaxID=1363 RepID=A0AAX3NE71_9LACT|nr:ATP-binding protein [Lactococcus garvieae]NHI70482.1 two-component sensor histidine kinase [Lactococcus garvieae]NHJ08280.1 two-component sensor histidine kinase [Lactococcus garvieae]WEA14917.1 ATP-binding protein [Lactococcus garvieae]